MPDAVEQLLQRALQSRREGRLADARRDLDEALSFLRRAGSRTSLARALRELGELERTASDDDAARRHYEEAIAVLREANEPLSLAHAIRHLGDVHAHGGRGTQAESCYREALAIYRSHAETRPLDLANAIRSFAVLEGESGRTDESLRLWREAHDLYASLNVASGVAESAARMARFSPVPERER